MIRKDDILEATEYGKTVILYYYPQAAAGFTSKRNFRIRPDGSDRKPSGTVFFKENMWFLQDKGGGDNRAYNAITLVMEKEGLGFPQAIDWIAAKFAPHLLSPGSAPAGKPEPRISPAAPSDTVTVNLRPGGRFTERELALLGWKITQDICGHFSLKPVDSYVTRRNSRGKSFRIEATESYPIYYYDYGTWGKLYQPLGEVRFMYVGSKPEGWIFGDDRFRRLYDAAAAGRLSTVPDPEDVDEYTADTVEDERMERLIICSGPSDAINAYAAGFNVCWPNSESEDPDPLVMSRLFRIAKDVYICYDIDETGLRNMYRIALQWLNLRVIRLPDKLAEFKARGGKPCKDIKDYMMFFRKPGRNNPHKNFADLATVSSALKFWTMIDRGSKAGVTYDIRNIPMFAFLEANGFYCMPSPSDKKGFKFVRIDGNRVTILEDEGITKTVKSFMREFLRENTIYYTELLEEQIERSRQITLERLYGLAVKDINLTSWSRDEEWLFFSNTAVRVTAGAVETVPSGKCPYFYLSQKEIKHDFSVEKPLFDIRMTPEAAELLAAMETARRDHGPRSPEYLGLRKRYDGLTELGKWTASMLRDDCTFMKYVWNTGRPYWRKEELGLPLEEAEEAETELNFVNKCMAIGYLLSKYKDASKPYAVYCMEMEEGANGEHNGGTGKSLFAKSIRELRVQVEQTGQSYDPDDKFLLERVEKDITDCFFLDDLSTRVDLHRFMPEISGDITVNAKYVKSFSIPFDKSPKFVFTSNHAIRNFDASLRRRTFFTAFSDYYHAEDSRRRLPERTPASEFGKQLISDYDDREMNGFYNFMIQCLQLWMRYRQRVNPPMKAIEQRTLRNSMGDDFLWWADEYFDETHLNREVDKHEAFEAYKDSISDKAAGYKTLRTFTDNLRKLCDYKGWVLNPDRVLQSKSDKDRGEIRHQVDGKCHVYFYISTQEQEDPPGEDEPPFAP